MFWVVPRNFVTARDKLRKWVIGCIQGCPTILKHSIRVFIQCVLSREKLRKLVSAAYKAWVYASGTISCFFCNEHAQSTTLGPKLMFWVVSRNFIAAWDKLRKWVIVYIQGCPTILKHPIRLFIQWVLSREQLRKLVSAAYKARVYASGTVSCFVTSNKPNPLFQSKTHVLGGSMPFRSCTWHVEKTGIEVHLMHEFMPPEPFIVF